MENPIYVHVPDLQDNSFFFLANKFPPGTYYPFHMHPELELQCVDCGHGHRIIGGVMEEFSEGAVHLVPGNVPHVWCYSSNEEKPVTARSMTIQFKAEALTKCLSSVPELRKEVEFIANLKDAIEIKGESAVNIATILKSMVKQSAFDRYISFLRVMREVANATVIKHIKVNHIMTENPRSLTKIQQVFAYMEENHDKNFTLEDVAASVGMNKASFCKFFKQLTGRTFTIVVNDIRINRAAMLLINSPSMSVSEVAYSVGYESLSHFNHMFQQRKGESPSAYRARFLGTTVNR